MRHLWLCVFMLIGTLTQAQGYLTYQQLPDKLAKRYVKARSAARTGDYTTADKELQKLLDDEPAFFDGLVLRADIAYDRDDYAQAATWYAQALTLTRTEDPIVLYRAGLNAMRQKEFATAATYFADFLATGAGKDDLQKRAKKYRKDALFAAVAYSHPVEFTPRSISDSINTPGREYLPAFTADGKYMIYTANRDRQEDFYYSRQDESGNWQPGKPMIGINTPLNEGAISISDDGQYIVFTACNRPDGAGLCDLYSSEYRDSKWSAPRSLGPAINGRASERQPTLSADAKTLYFSSTRSGGLGGYDIWKSTRQRDGSWSEPVNLGEPINTADNEESPFLHADGQTLYFMSDGHPGLGGYDLFLSRREDNTWSEPINLGYPINTPADEGALTVSLDGHTAYYSTNENTGDGMEATPLTRENIDIYEFALYPAARPRPVTYLRAIVKEAGTNRPLAQVVADISNAETNEYIGEKKTLEDGSFLIVLPAGQNYSLRVSEEGYLFYSDFFALRDSNTLLHPFELIISLQPIPTQASTTDSEPVVLRNVFFATGQATLKANSQAELNELATLLKDNPTLRIRLNGHTDNVGQPADNQRLGEARAKAVYTYLIEQGIASARLEYAGFGETKPVADNATAAGRALNRRTEFQVLGQK